jgi:hypothetical protein
MAEFTAPTRSRMGCFMVASKIALRGWNHSRRLLRFSARRKAMASGEKPGN